MDEKILLCTVYSPRGNIRGGRLRHVGGLLFYKNSLTNEKVKSVFLVGNWENRMEINSENILSSFKYTFHLSFKKYIKL